MLAVGTKLVVVNAWAWKLIADNASKPVNGEAEIINIDRDGDY